VARVITRMNIGGPAHHVAILAAGLRPEYETLLITGAPEAREGDLADAAERAGVTLQRIPSLRRPLHPLRDLRALVALVRAFRAFRPDIVATHTAKAGTLGRIAALITRVPVRVHTFHGHVLEGYFGSRRATLFRCIERLLARVTTRLVVVSPEVAHDLEQLGVGHGNVTVVRLGLRLDELADSVPNGALRAELGARPATPTVGIVGRLVPIKAHEVFLRAAALLQARLPEVLFVVAGDGELWAQLHERAADLGVERNVRFLGWRHDLATVYGDLDVVVCSSHNEGTPVSLIEAGAAGRAVVATRVGGVPDVVEDGINGLLVPANDPGALAGAIERLLLDPELRARLGSAGRSRALSRYGAERLTADIRAIYGELMAAANQGLSPDKVSAR